jgi:hypothetical protein
MLIIGPVNGFWVSRDCEKSHENVKISRSGCCLKRSIWSFYPITGGFYLKSSKFLKALPGVMVRMDGMVEIRSRSEMGKNDGKGQSTGL